MILRIIDKTAEALGVLAFLVSSTFIFINVLNRYLVLGYFRDIAGNYEVLRPIYFEVRNLLGGIVVTADEVPGLLLVWVAFLGAYFAMRQQGHISFDLLLAKLNYPVRRVVLGINMVLIVGFLGILFWQSIRMILVAGATEIETAEIYQGWFMLIIPISAVLMIIAVIHRFFITDLPN